MQCEKIGSRKVKQKIDWCLYFALGKRPIHNCDILVFEKSFFSFQGTEIRQLWQFEEVSLPDCGCLPHQSGCCARWNSIFWHQTKICCTPIYLHQPKRTAFKNQSAQVRNVFIDQIWCYTCCCFFMIVLWKISLVSSALKFQLTCWIDANHILHHFLWKNANKPACCSTLKGPIVELEYLSTSMKFSKNV